MRKIAILLGLAAFVLSLSSCGGPEADANKMIKKMENLTKAINDAAEDGKIEDKEAENINKLIKELDELSDEMEKKYEGKDEEKEKVDKIVEEKGEKVEEEFMEAFTKAMECEGIDKIKFD